MTRTRISVWRLLSVPCALLVFAVLAQAQLAGTVQAQVACGVDETRLTLDGEEQAAVDLVNLARGRAGLPPLTVSDALLRNALWKSTDLAASGSLAQDDSFRPWLQRFADCGYDTSRGAFGQVIGRGLPTGAAMVALWQSMQSTNDDLLDPRFTELGLKRTHAVTRDDWTWVLMLGGHADADSLGDVPEP